LFEYADAQSLEELDIDLSRVLADPDPARTRPRRALLAQNEPPFEETLDDWLFQAGLGAVETREPIALEHAIHNTDRAVGARLAGEIATRFGDMGLPLRTISCSFHGSAGQSFGAFCINGMRLDLVGDANDYVGKGMAGGEIILRVPSRARYASNENFILGNTGLYGATGGMLFAAGRAGERFAVRNSGAVAVVEGVGDHGCEYMTGGAVVVLGTTGRNFGAGMTGGVAFILDLENAFLQRLNDELVRAERVADVDEDLRLSDLVKKHISATDSAWARGLFDRWNETRKQFWRVVPK
jgi:glutamate synthase (ferredoxin)